MDQRSLAVPADIGALHHATALCVELDAAPTDDLSRTSSCLGEPHADTMNPGRRVRQHRLLAIARAPVAARYEASGLNGRENAVSAE